MTEESKAKLRGKWAWNKGLTKETDARVAKYVENRKGRIVSKETGEKISKALMGRKHSKEQNKENSKRMKKMWADPNSIFNSDKFKNSSFGMKKNQRHSERTKEKIRKKNIGKNLGKKASIETKRILGKITKVRWQDPKFIKKILKSRIQRPTNPEKIFDKITPDNIKYVGSGDWWRKTKKKYRNPDFKIMGQNKVIEIYGDYWHRNDNPKDIIQEYKEIGLDCLVFWETEIYNETKRILKEALEFISQK